MNMPFGELNMQRIDEEAEGALQTHSSPAGLFSRAFVRHNDELADVLRSLDQLHCQLNEVDVDYDDVESFSEGNKTALYASITLVKHMLSETQSKFQCMMDDNQMLGSRIDSSLKAAQSQVTELRSELTDTHRIINKLAGSPGGATCPVNDPTAPVSDPSAERSPEARRCSAPANSSFSGFSGFSSDEDQTAVDDTVLSSMSRDQLVEQCQNQLQREQALRQKNRCLRSQVAGLTSAGDALEAETVRLRCKLKACEAEVALTKEALAALKADRKRLKAEKFDLLNQMKQLYQTLEDKERELREFIRNYEMRIKESDESMRSLSAEREETEREKWNILKHARDEAERSVGLSAELGSKEGQLKQVSDELTQLRKRLSQLGYASDHESSGCTAAAAVAASTLSPAAPGATPNGRGSSADSGVRVSSDRDGQATSGNISDSTTSGEGTGYLVTGRAAAPNRRSAGGRIDYDSVSMVSSRTACSPHYHYYCNSGVNGQQTSPTLSPLTLTHTVDVNAISKSAEQLDSLEQLDRKIPPKTALKQAAWGSISRVFSRQKQRKHAHGALYNDDLQWSPPRRSSLSSSPLTDELYAEKLRLLEEAQQLPMDRWKASMVLAWLQVTLGMPQYGPACAESVRSGKVMLELSDLDLERSLGIAHAMHRRKLRLAVEELRQPHLCKYPYISQLNHTWVSSEWLPDVGLAQYSEIFAANLTDGRMLAHLSKKDMEKYLNVTRKFHQISMMHGIQLLRLLQFDRQMVTERRQRSELNGDDVIMWTNQHFISWARSVDLPEYADNLKDSGVHGALAVLELSFTAETMAMALGLPASNSGLRRHLTVELEKLIRPARVLLDEEARYARWERERRRADRPVGTSTLGRKFSRSYAGGLQSSSDKDKRSSSLRGSLSRALGLRARHDRRLGSPSAEPVYETALERPQSVVSSTHPQTSSSQQPHHRRIRSISDMEALTVTPV